MLPISPLFATSGLDCFLARNTNPINKKSSCEKKIFTENRITLSGIGRTKDRKQIPVIIFQDVHYLFIEHVLGRSITINSREFTLSSIRLALVPNLKNCRLVRINLNKLETEFFNTHSFLSYMHIVHS